MTTSISLTRQALLQIGTVSSYSSMIVIPSSSKNKGKVIVSDDTGLLHGFSIKKGLIETDFKLNVPEGTIHSLSLGGATNARDKIFVSSGTVVRGYSRKGKEFFELRTNLSEPFRFMAIEDVHLYGGGEYIFNHFKDGHDEEFTMLPDRIGALVIDHVSKPVGDNEILIGCADRMVRFLIGSVIQFELPVEGAVTALSSWSTVYDEITMNNSSTSSSSTNTSTVITRTRYFVYGCSTGHVGFFGISSTGGFVKYWSFLPSDLPNVTNDTVNGMVDGTTGLGVSNISIFPMSNQSLLTSPATNTGNGNTNGISSLPMGPEIIVGRENGQVEVYTVDNIETLPGLGIGNTNSSFAPHAANDPNKTVHSSSTVRFDTTLSSSVNSMTTVPRLLGSANVQESIRCIATGCITNTNIPEIFVLTFSGRLMSFTTEKLTEIDKDDNSGRTKETVQRQAQIKTAKKDIDELRKEVMKQKEKLDKLRTPSSSSGNVSTNPLSLTNQILIPTYPVVTNFNLNIDEGLYYLTIEIPIPIEYVILQSTVPLNLPDTISSSNATDGSSPPGSEGRSFNEKNKYSNNTGTVVTLATTSDSITNNINGKQHNSRQVIAVARPIDNANRVTIRVRLIEGEAGEIISMVLPTSNPKASIVSRIPIKPLCLYSRLTETPEDIEKRLGDAWTDFYTRRKQEQENIQSASNSNVGSRASNATDDDDLNRQSSSNSNSRLPNASVPTGADDTSLAAQTSAFTTIAKSSADPQVTASALALKSLTPAQSANLATVPQSFPWSFLRTSGTFSLSQMHEWVGNCIPDIPARLIADGRTENVNLVFRNIFVGSHLITRYTKGNATFVSDNPTTISILRDALNNAASAVKVRLNVTLNISPFATRHILSLIHPRLMYSLTLNLRAELSEAVKEMISADNTNPVDANDNRNASSRSVPAYLHPEFADVYTNGEKYASEIGSGGSNADALFGIVTDMFVDSHKLQGNDVTNKLFPLTNLLPRYHVSITNHPTTRYLQQQQQRVSTDASIRGSELIASCIENPSMLT